MSSTRTKANLKHFAKLLREGATPGDVARTHGLDFDATNNVALWPGYWADDGNGALYCPDAETAGVCARQYVDHDTWENTTTTWAHVTTWREGLDADGDEVQLGRERHTIAIDPPAPACTEGHEHRWTSPEWLGGCKENPGVWGHGGGVVIHEVCPHCGTLRRTDTWAQDRETGEQGLESVEYREGEYTDRVRAESDNELR